jgi:hypothetical protein
VRRKIDVPFGVQTLATVRGVGYLLSADRVAKSAAAPLPRA